MLDADECPYHVCEDAEEGNAEEFCYWKGTEELFAGTCGQGGYFNDTDGICTCTNMTGKKVNISMQKYPIMVHSINVSAI